MFNSTTIMIIMIITGIFVNITTTLSNARTVKLASHASCITCSSKPSHTPSGYEGLANQHGIRP